MMRIRFVFVLVCALAMGAGSLLAAAPSRDETAIRELQSRQAEAWNRHDAKAYAALFAEKADVVNIAGWWWQGRPEIERKLNGAFAYTFRESTLTIIDVNVRFLSSTIAIVHVDWTMTGAKMPEGVPEPRQGIQIQVLEKVKKTWRIASFQNTLSIPEASFPSAPPTPSTSGTPR